MVSYTYNAWGEIISTTGTLASTIGVVNKLRYRSYYYDSETGFYYLQSRYYDPIVKRFISPDSTDYLTANGDFDGYNLYAYCLNNPINRIDVSGTASYFGTLPKYTNNYYIYHQGENYTIPGYGSRTMQSIRLGYGNIARNGCGVIACYNILKFYNSGTTFRKVFRYFNNISSLLWFGRLGVLPSAIESYMLMYFKKLYSTNVFESKQLRALSKCQAVIILTANMNSWHYIGCVNIQNTGCFMVFNYSSLNGRIMKLQSIRNTMNKNNDTVVWMLGMSGLR